MSTIENFTADTPASGAMATTDKFPIYSNATSRAAYATVAQLSTALKTDVAAAGTVEASKAVVLDANKSASGFGALTGTDPVRGLGYATGAGGAVTQATNRSTGVTTP